MEGLKRLNRKNMKNDISTTQATTDMETAESLKTAKENILNELKKRIIGQNEVIEQLLIALFSQGTATCRGAGVSEDPINQYIRADSQTPFQPNPIYARPDAIGHYRHRYY